MLGLVNACLFVPHEKSLDDDATGTWVRALDDLAAIVEKNE